MTSERHSLDYLQTPHSVRYQNPTLPSHKKNGKPARMSLAAEDSPTAAPQMPACFRSTPPR